MGSDKFYQVNEWLGAPQVNFIKRLVSTSCTKTWSQVAEESRTVNLWEQRVKELKARRNFASSKNLGIDAVSIADILASEEGLDHWADVVLVAQISNVKAKTKPKQKAKAPPGPTNTVAKVEKDLKAQLASEFSGSKRYQELLVDVDRQPESFAWATGFLNDIAVKQKDVEAVKQSEFYQAFATAVLSSEEMKKLKKEKGLEFHSLILRLLDDLRPKVEAVALDVEKVYG